MNPVTVIDKVKFSIYVAKANHYALLNVRIGVL